MIIPANKRRLFRLIVPKYPSFNVYSRIARKTTALGPICVATMVSRIPGWDAEIIDENNYRFPGPIDSLKNPNHVTLQEMRPATAVGFYGSLSCTIPRLQELAGFYRAQGVLTIGGGSHLDAMPEESLVNGLDIVVHGEGEYAILEILAALEANQPYDSIAGISYIENGSVHRTEPRPPIEEFEMLPLPDFGLLRYAAVTVFPVSRIRGCGANCEFCSIKGRARCASPERLLGQISYLAETHQAREFFVVDDQFAQDRDETLRFCKILQEYQERMHLRFFVTVQIRLDMAKDERLLTAMMNCGIRCLAIGFESVIDAELTAMGKQLRAANMLDLVQRYKKHGFLIHGMFIFGYPMREGIEFNMSASERVTHFKTFIRKARLDTVQVLLPVPLPGTELRTRLEDQGRVFPQSRIGWEYYDGNFPLIQPDAPMTAEQVQQGIISIMHGFYRFRHFFGIGLRTLWFPFAMLPLVNLRARFLRWYNPWRNDIIRFGGWCIVRQWKKNFKENRFMEKLHRLMEQGNQSAGTKKSNVLASPKRGS